MDRKTNSFIDGYRDKYTESNKENQALNRTGIINSEKKELQKIIKNQKKQIQIASENSKENSHLQELLLRLMKK